MAELSERAKNVIEMFKTLTRPEQELLLEWMDALIRLNEVEAKMKAYADEQEKSDEKGGA